MSSARSSKVSAYLKELKDSKGNYKETPCRYSNVQGVGTNLEEELCGFATLPRYSYEQYKSNRYNIPDPFTTNKGTKDKEFMDFLHEIPIMVIPKGTIITHTTKIDDIVDKDDFRINIEAACWWKRYLPGQQEYKGGWFTYGKSIGPSFGLRLGYRLKTDISLLYIPNTYANIWKAQDPEYFDVNKVTIYDTRYPPSDTVNEIQEEDEDDEEEDSVSFKRYYSGSHVIQGVKGWQAKGYDKIPHEYFADKLGIRLANLGITGYISCDECEVYLTHEIMKKCLEEPEEIWPTDPINDKRVRIINAYCASQPSKSLQVTPTLDRNKILKTWISSG